jgi:hypothetical protein
MMLDESYSEQKHDSTYSAYVSQDTWNKLKQIISDLGLDLLFEPNQVNEQFFFKVGGTIEQTNELSRRLAEFDQPNRDTSKF